MATPNLMTCAGCGSVYDADHVAAQVTGKKADKITVDGRHPVAGPVQVSINCKVCGDLLYREVDGESVPANRRDHLAAMTKAERVKHMTAEELSAAAPDAE